MKQSTASLGEKIDTLKLHLISHTAWKQIARSRKSRQIDLQRTDATQSLDALLLWPALVQPCHGLSPAMFFASKTLNLQLGCSNSRLRGIESCKAFPSGSLVL